MSVFQFKQFAVDQSGCAMKVNTDGVLLGALADGEGFKSILDIGTGTGVVALMLAQRFRDVYVDAVEIDETAANTASKNFSGSPFAERLKANHTSFQDFFKADVDKKYDLIVSNPPFHLNSLPSAGKAKATARHTGNDFFVELINAAPNHLNSNGKLSLVLPEQAAALVKTLAVNAGLFLQHIIEIQSYPHSAPHRQIVTFGLQPLPPTIQSIVIYSAPKVYTAQYRTVLSNFLTIF